MQWHQPELQWDTAKRYIKFIIDTTSAIKENDEWHGSSHHIWHEWNSASSPAPCHGVHRVPKKSTRERSTICCSSHESVQEALVYTGHVLPCHVYAEWTGQFMDSHRWISWSRIWLDKAANLTDADMDLLNIHSFIVSVSVAHGQNRWVLCECCITDMSVINRWYM